MRVRKPRKFKYSIIVKYESQQTKEGYKVLPKESTVKTIYSLSKKNVIAELKAMYRNKTVILHGLKRTIIRPNIIREDYLV